MYIFPDSMFAKFFITAFILSDHHIFRRCEINSPIVGFGDGQFLYLIADNCG